MKLRFFILFIALTFNYAYGNMASPWREGTLGSSPFINQFVEIQNEKIDLKINAAFTEATYEIKYTINALKDGINIPLLFLALEYEKDFEILLDGILIELKRFPYEYDYQSDSSPIKNFKYCLEEDGEVSIKWNENFSEVRKLHDLKYFEVDLSKGVHTFEIKYVAQAYIFHDNWVKAYSFRYSLSPTKHWKSFGTLEINVTLEELKEKITCNLEAPSQGKEMKQMKWKFDSIPSETLIIQYDPEISTGAQWLISLGPDNMALLVFFMLIILHFFLAKSYRKKSSAKYSWVIILGSLLNPFLLYLAYSYSFGSIDYFIGEHASRMHDSTFLALFLYPFAFVIYLTIAWQVDAYWLRRKNKMT